MRTEEEEEEEGGGRLSPECVSSTKPVKSSVWLEQKIKECSSELCYVRLLAALLAGTHQCFFGHFQRVPKQTGMALLTGHKTCVLNYRQHCTSQRARKRPRFLIERMFKVSRLLQNMLKN